MYQETYDEYIRSILGYPNYNQNIYENNYNMTNYRHMEQNAELESCYPDIYKVVYPMVTKACANNTKPVTSALIDELTNEIFLAVENENTNNVKKEPIRENRGEDRQFRHGGLQDLIRILLIRELLGRPGNFPPNRPPLMPPRPPMRPPFPGGPGPGRPPVMPRDN